MLTVEHAELVWTGTRELSGATLVCDHGQVAQVLTGGSDAAAGADAAAAAPNETATETATAPTRLDASGCVVIPGLVNAHHHLLQSAFRTYPATRHVPMQIWLAEMIKLYQQAKVDPTLVATAAAVAMAEGLLCGVTTVADHHLTWTPDFNPPEIATATIETARDMGQRLVFVHGTACGQPSEVADYLAELVARYLDEPSAAAGDGDGTGGTAIGVSADGMFQLAIGPAGTHSDDQAMFEAMAATAQTLKLRRRSQANEQVDVELAIERYGRRPLELLAEWGWLQPDVTLAHLCDITDDERQLVSSSGISVTHAPGCDVPMGWGIAEVGQLLDAGTAVGLGTSGGGSNDAGHLLADARLAMQVSGLSSRPLTARECLAMATSGSAAGLGRADTLGHLEPGAAADLCCYDFGGPDNAGVADTLAGLLWASPGRKPRHVVVAGEVVVRDWQLVNQDAEHLVAALKHELQTRLG